MQHRSRRSFLPIIVFAILSISVAADAACPTPGTYVCEAICTLSTPYCQYSGDPCGLCKDMSAGCASWTSCSCCAQFAPSF